ncbi:hypothetical protein HC931_08635 [Candidatus Gracilibacteria bacterium]|nr:hypothetical protein [Candidatus Gracilibacteria bacterium]
MSFPSNVPLPSLYSCLRATSFGLTTALNSPLASCIFSASIFPWGRVKLAVPFPRIFCREVWVLPAKSKVPLRIPVNGEGRLGKMRSLSIPCAFTVVTQRPFARVILLAVTVPLRSQH